MAKIGKERWPERGEGKREGGRVRERRRGREERLSG